MKKTIAVLLTAFMLFACAACSNESATPSGSEGQTGSQGQTVSGIKYVGDTKVVYNEDIQKDGVKRLGVAYSTVKYEASQLLVNAYATHYKDYGFDECVALSADGNLETQISQIQDLINQKCDVIIVNSVDMNGVAAVCDLAMQSGVALMAVDRKIGTEIYYTLETDNTSAGRDLAMTMADRCYYDGIKDGEIHVMIDVGDMSSSAQWDRQNGFETTLSFYPWMKVVATPKATETSEVYNAVIDAFTADPTIRCIYVPGDNDVTPAVAALRELGMLRDPSDPNYVFIGSIDGAAAAIEAIRKGESSFCANQRFDLFYSQIMEVARDYCDGTYVKPSANNVQLSCAMIQRSTVDNLEKLKLLWAIGGLPR